MAIQEDRSRVFIPEGLRPAEFKFSSPEAFLHEAFARSEEALVEIPDTAKIADLKSRTVFDWRFEQGIYEQQEVGVDINMIRGVFLVGDRFKAGLVLGRTVPSERPGLQRKFSLEFGFAPNLREAPSDAITSLRQLIRGDLPGSIHGKMALNDKLGIVELSYVSDIKHGPRQNEPFVLNTTTAGLTDAVCTMTRFAGRVSR